EAKALAVGEDELARRNPDGRIGAGTVGLHGGLPTLELPRSGVWRSAAPSLPSQPGTPELPRMPACYVSPHGRSSGAKAGCGATAGDSREESSDKRRLGMTFCAIVFKGWSYVAGCHGAPTTPRPGDSVPVSGTRQVRGHKGLECRRCLSPLVRSGSRAP